MKFKKTFLFYIFLLILLLGIFCFGVMVGAYRIPPFIQIYQTKQFLEKKINNLFSTKVPKVTKGVNLSKPIRFVSFGDIPYMREKDFIKYSKGLLEAINSQNP